MANDIKLVKKYIPLIDEKYRLSSLTEDLTSDSTLVRQGANANEIVCPKVEVGGLGDYTRNGGYTTASVKFEWETYKFNYDRGAKIEVDTMDDEETFDLAFLTAAGALQSDRVAPEGDAFTFATLASVEGISKATPATYADGAEFLAALVAANAQMDEDEVPGERRYLYATPTLVNAIMALDTTKSREVLSTFEKIVKVPQRRFYTAIDLLDGKSEGEEAGHFVKNADAKDINFMIVQKDAVLKWDKHVASNLISPEINANADGWISKYRKYGIVDVFRNKVAGIYLSHKA